MKRVMILGSTGSIGRNTLDIIRAKPDLFRIVALSAHRQQDELRAQIKEFKPQAVSLTDRAIDFKPGKGTEFFSGYEECVRMIGEVDADIVINGIAGSAGLLPSIAAIKSGKTLALANKETIVMAGDIILSLARHMGVGVIPVDSEHSAIFHLIGSDRKRVLDEIILTASGGAFRDVPKEKLDSVTVEDALKHPNWNMGPKITIDSATMANKALEVIEAHYLFELPSSRIKAVIHPQSFVHSLIRTRDGSLYAQMSKPDMRIPIQNALTWPEMIDVGFGRLDIENTVLEFKAVDHDKYPLLGLGYRACEAGGAYPTVFNAANEVAVDQFVKGEIRYTDIARVVEEALNLTWSNLNTTIDDVILNDAKARKKALEISHKMR